jgi:uncharacterized protein YxeA
MAQKLKYFYGKKGGEYIMKKIVSLLIAMVFSLSISAFAIAEVKPAADAAAPKVEEKKAEPAAKETTTKKKHTKKKKKKTAKKTEKTEKAEKAPEMPAEKK